MTILWLYYHSQGTGWEGHPAAAAAAAAAEAAAAAAPTAATF